MNLFFEENAYSHFSHMPVAVATMWERGPVLPGHTGQAEL